MANCILAAPDFIFPDPAFATVSFSGGSWLPALPISNLADPAFAVVARSTNTALASTQFWIDLGLPRLVQVVAIPQCNGSTACQIRVRGCATKDTATVVTDSGWGPLYPIVYPIGTLLWGHPSLWDGLLSAEDAAIFPMPYVQVFAVPQSARYWLVEISDVANPAGYLQLPRIVVAPGWQPSFNLNYGATLTVEDNSPIQTSQGAAEFFDLRTKRRVVHFSIAYLPQDEALAIAGDLHRRLGVSGQLFFIWNPDNAVHIHRRSFLSRMRTLSALDAAVHGRMTAQFELVEVVA